jgi:hypothetical protein
VNNQALSEQFSELSTPLIADAALRLRVPLRIAPGGIRPVISESRIAGARFPQNISAASTFFSKQWNRQEWATFW